MAINHYDIKVQGKIFNALRELRNVGISHFISLLDEEDLIFKPYFKSITDILRKHKVISDRYKVRNIWFDDAAYSWHEEPQCYAYFNITCLDSVYNEIKVSSAEYTNKGAMNERAAGEVADVLFSIANAIKVEMEKSKQTPTIEDIEDKILDCFKDNIDENYVVNVEVGKLNSQGNIEPYKSFVIRNKFNEGYISSITFSKDKVGLYHLCNRVPLCGSSDRAFKLADMEEAIIDALKFIGAY